MRHKNQTKRGNTDVAYNSRYLSNNQKKEMNELIMKYSKNLPREFNRKGQSLDNLSNWKAVEFRLFLLYTGPVILQDVLEPRLYDHFLYLHGAILVLSSPNVFRWRVHKRNSWINFADRCLRYYVAHFEDIYGEHHIVYNVHSLIHLAEECFAHGNLELFSAFIFESYLGYLKSLLKGKHRELSELGNKVVALRSFKHT